MKDRIIILAILINLFLSMGFFSCDRPNPMTSKIEDGNETALMKLNFTNIPDEVKKIVVYLSREGYDTLIQEILVAGQEAYCRFEGVAAGTWHLKVNALGDEENILYAGETDVTVIAGQTVNVNLELKAVGNVEIHVSWEQDEEYTFIYDFSDGDLSDWYGPANAEIYEEKLHIWSAIGWKWHTISNVSDTHFNSGIIDFEIKPLDGGYTFETKGASQSNWIQNWGVYIRWEAESIYVHAYEDEQSILVNTQISYEPNNWYHVQVIFDGQQGTKGKFSFLIENITQGGQKIYGGEYEYYAKYGRLVGVNLISLGCYDSDIPRDEEKHVYFDNFAFKVKL